MLPYFLLFCLVAGFALTNQRTIPKSKNSNFWEAEWWLIFLLLTIMIGMRHEVGADWEQYLGHVESVRGESFVEALGGKDPASSLLNWFGSYWGGVYLVNTICGVLFSYGLIVFCRGQPLPWLALVIAIPYLVIVVAMGYTRQGVAIGLSMIALNHLSRDQISRFFIWMAIAALFHKSAVILIPIAILAGSKRKFVTFVFGGVTAAALFILLLQESIDFLAYSYLEQDRYDSSGAGIRVAMNALPAVIFLLLKDRFAMSTAEKKLWTWIAWIAVGFVFLLFLSPSSTAVDRVALYFIPIQLYVYSRLPIAIGRKIGNKSGWIAILVIYSATVQIIWLGLGDKSNSWLPYQFYPWILLWG